MRPADLSHELRALVALVESCVGGTVRGSPRRLRGGIASDVYGITCDLGGHTQRVVARRYPRPRSGAPGEPTVASEASTLRQLEHLGVPTPRLLGVDETGDAAGVPSLVMTRLPGRLELLPGDPGTWTTALAEMLATVHSLGVGAPPYQPWLDLSSLEVPRWTRRPDLWSAALELLASAPPAQETTFVHGDYQQFNVLWHRGQISGVLDWTASRTGPPDVDVAHARLNFVCLYDVERAERFRLTYESHAGRATSAWRDVAELVGYAPRFAQSLRVQIARRMRLDAQHMTERVEALLRRTLERA